jgi:hypothetical protein
MKITPALFEALLKCPTKYHLRSKGETGSGNEYADWVRAHGETYEHEAARRLLETVPEAESVVAPPDLEHFKSTKWRLAVAVIARTRDRSADRRVRAIQRQTRRPPC